MAHALIGNIEPYDIASSSWDSYLKRVDAYFVANDLTGNDEAAEAKLRTVFLSLIGGDAFRTLENLVSPDDLMATPLKTIREKLTAHFSPKPLEIAVTHTFYSRYQADGENASEYLATLRHMAKHCAFPDLTRALRDQFVTGMRNYATQQKLLAIRNLTLDRALEEATAMEKAKKQGRSLRVSQPAPTEAIQRVSTSKEGKSATPTADKRNPCYRCGKPGHEPQKCWHKDKMCSAWNKKGHLASACRSKERGGRGKGSRRQKGVTHRVDRGDDNATDEDEYFLNAINTVPSKHDEKLMVHPFVEGKRLPMEVDTGAAVALVSRATWVKYFKDFALTKPDITLSTYSKEDLSVLGKRIVQIELEGQKAELPLFVVEGDGPSLFGRNWLREIKLNWKALGIARIGAGTRAEELVKEYEELFNSNLGTIQGFKASLKLKEGTTPTFLQARPAPYSMRDSIVKELDRLEEKGAMQRVSVSKWATPLVLVPKPEAALRLCGDYKHTVNKVLDVDQYPIPKPEGLFAQLAGSEKFTKLDLASAYHQVELEEASQEIVTLNTPQGLYRPVRLPFGIANSPAIFQNIMDQVLHGLPGVVCYLDDILVIGENDEQHLKNLQNVFERLKKHGIRLKPAKCVIMANEVEYLGHTVDATGRRATKAKKEAILNAPKPEDTKQLKAFLGLVNYYGRFCEQMATIAKPLNTLLKKETSGTGHKNAIKLSTN